jgi:Tfp pilus assembly protein PilN
MAQNVNLLEEITINKIYAFDSKLIIKISLSWILLLILIYLLTAGINMNKQRNLHLLEISQQNLAAKINSYNQILLPLKEQGVADLKNLPAGSTNILGFYRYFEDLAKLTPHGVWLNSFSFSEPDSLITIKGSAIIASSVSALINSLSNSEDFRNKKFDTIQLQENLETGNTDFTISTILPNPPEVAKK